MDYPQSAAKDLAVIRSLMERATVYRAISAPTALAGASLAFTASALIFLAPDLFGSAISPGAFVAIWLTALALTSAFNFLLIYRDASGSSQAFISPGMRHALQAIAPPMFAGGVLGISVALFEQQPAYASLIWILCYGLALCATGSFAPRSIRRLGFAFLALGTILLAVWHLSGGLPTLPVAQAGALFMGLTFGFLHLIYAGCIRLRGRAS